nr:photosystem I P700 chlorophyll a apoprotein A2-like [Aegilops tauschii subsp. strangulata]
MRLSRLAAMPLACYRGVSVRGIHWVANNALEKLSEAESDLLDAAMEYNIDLPIGSESDGVEIGICLHLLRVTGKFQTQNHHLGTQGKTTRRWASSIWELKSKRKQFNRLGQWDSGAIFGARTPTAATWLAEARRRSSAAPPPGGRLGRGHKGLYDTINNSIHFQLGLALASLGVITSLVAQHMYSLPPYAFIAQDFTTQAALYTHHQYIAGFIMTGAFAHGAIFFIRDYNPEQNEDNVLARMLDHKEAIISHLSWASLFLGFHTLGLYVHNDVMLAFGTPEKQILIEPIFSQWIQSAHGKTTYGFDILLFSTNGPAFNAGRSLWLPGWLNAVNENSNSLFLTIGPGDFLVHHAIALGLHTTTLILVKGALDARGSKLMPDKKDFGYSFPCDGPGRGGTCDISAWDAFYLAVFWMLNTIGWVTFYWHWKHITLWQGNVSQFNESSTYLMGWLRDYLWLNSSQLINGYNPFGMNSLSVWAWMFLFGHLVWATGFMFLISWRGYWQELIETLAWAHERTPLANLIRWRDKPVALSIVQARLVGLAHFSVGYIFTYAAFLIASTSGKFG